MCVSKYVYVGIYIYIQRGANGAAHAKASQLRGGRSGRPGGV